MIPASDFIGRISHRPLKVKVRRNLVQCAGVDATKTLPARSCDQIIVGCGAPDRKYRCDACKKEQKRRWDAANQQNKTKREMTAPETPWQQTARSDDFRRLDAELGRGNWRGEYRPREEFSVGGSATPFARIEAQDVEGKRTYRR